MLPRLGTVVVLALTACPRGGPPPDPTGPTAGPDTGSGDAGDVDGRSTAGNATANNESAGESAGTGDGTGGPSEHPRKPSWWPDPNTQTWGLKWPPPRPEDWPQGKPWPPLREVGEDPKFWAELFGEDLDAERDPRFGRSGEDGEDLFRYNFDQIGLLDEDKKPGCGMHVMPVGGLRSRTSCTPFPEAEVRALCKIAFDQGGALRKCQNHCLRNERRCRRARLIEPPISSYWRCATFPCFEHYLDPTSCTNVAHQSDCFAFYICDCYEA